MPRLLLTLLIFLLAFTGGSALAFCPARTVSLTLHGQQESENWTGGPLDGLTVDGVSMRCGGARRWLSPVQEEACRR